MNQQIQTREAKVEKQCATLADIVSSIRPVYLRADAVQRALIETMIGAAIWYIPKVKDAWTGHVSLRALMAFHPDSETEKPKLSEEHVYPRKVAARMLLCDETLDAAAMCKVFREKYGQLHLVTPDENKSVQRYQRVAVFSTPEDAYSKANIKLVRVAGQDLRQIKKRDRETIDKYLKDQQ